MLKTNKKVLVHINIYASQLRQMVDMRTETGIPLAEIHRRALTAFLPQEPQPPTTSPREETITT